MITIICGKSASGKDTLAKELLKEQDFCSVVPVTTRPIRQGEVDGRDYHFLSKEDFEKKINNHELLEYRSYDTLENGVPDTWYYGTPKLSKEEMEKSIILVLPLDAVASVLTEYGRTNCFVVYLNATDSVREERASMRGSFDKTEWDRRLENETIIYSKENIDHLCNASIQVDNQSVDEIADDVCELMDSYIHAIEKSKCFITGQLNIDKHLWINFEMDRETGCWEPFAYDMSIIQSEEEYLDSFEEKEA